MKPPRDLGAWEAYQHGVALIHERTPEALEEATRHLEAAIERDPNFASAYSALGIATWVQIFRHQHFRGYTESAAERMFWLASQASRLDPKDSDAHIVRGIGYFLRAEYDAAIREMDAGVSLNPSSAFGIVMRAGAKTMSFLDHEGALDDLALAGRLSPTDPHSRGFRLGQSANANFHLGRYEEAVRLGEESFRANGFFGPLAGIAACVALGDIELARRRFEDLKALHNGLTMQQIRDSLFYMPNTDSLSRWLEFVEVASKQS